MTKEKKSDLHAKSIVLYLRFSDDAANLPEFNLVPRGRDPFVQQHPLDKSNGGSGDEIALNWRRFDNLTHAQKARAGKFQFRSASSSHSVVNA